LKKTLKYLSVVAAVALVTGVAVAPASQAAKIKACVVLDTGGVDDHSFNAGAWAGAQSTSAIADVSYLPSSSAADFAPNIKKFIDQKCAVIIGVGFSISGEIVKAGKANPTIKFAVVDDSAMDCNADYSVCNAVANVKGLTFSTDQAAFQAGYLAAGYSKTGTVATYGGAPYPTVTIFMDGFAKGVAYYNKAKKKNVKVLGWDPAKKTGTFVGDFSNTSKASQLSQGFEQQGADVIMPVAGGLGGSTAKQSQQSGKSVTVWVDTDGYYSAPQYGSVLLTTVAKGLGAAVKSVITDVKKGTFTGAPYVGTLANGGVSISPLHDFASKVPSRLQLEVKMIGRQIASGTLKI
jgi:basic membrane protein A and related proteins